jgi:branched-chain amino acid transport system ATP-binding protein
LLVEQNANQALTVADRGYVMETGRIVLEGDSQALRDNEDVQKAYLGKASRNVEAQQS